MPHMTIRKVRVEGGTGGYRKVNDIAWQKLPMRTVFLDGVDGDEERDTVTYYYTRYRSLAEAEDAGRYVA